jgi:hypothetical protein
MAARARAAYTSREGLISRPQPQEGEMSIRVATCALCAFVALASAPYASAQGRIEVFGQTVSVVPGTITDGQHGAGSNCTVIPTTDLTPREHSDAVHAPVPGYIEAASHPQAFVYTSLHLEPGIEISSLCARVYDTDPGHELVVLLGGFESGSAKNPPVGVTLASMATGVQATPGYELMCADIKPPVTVRTSGDLNNDGIVGTLQYWVAAVIPNCEVMAGPIILTWHRPVSPAPLTGTFGDVLPDHRYFRFIEALAAAGVTGGCGDGLYCPDEPITRGEVAVFLASALSLYWPN